MLIKSRRLRSQTEWNKVGIVNCQTFKKESQGSARGRYEINIRMDLFSMGLWAPARSFVSVTVPPALNQSSLPMTTCLERHANLAVFPRVMY